MRVRSSGHLEFNFGVAYAQAALDDITVTSGYGGIQIASDDDLDITSVGDMTFEAGILSENSEIVFADGSDNTAILFSAGSDLDLLSDGNMLITGHNVITYRAESTMDFTATKGDMLFRSITSSGGNFFDLTLNGNTEVHITAEERIEHRQVS